MDPNACYRELLEAEADGDLETARERAQDLKQWLAKGGFPPQGPGPLEVFAKIQEILHPSLD